MKRIDLKLASSCQVSERVLGVTRGNRAWSTKLERRGAIERVRGSSVGDSLLRLAAAE